MVVAGGLPPPPQVEMMRVPAALGSAREVARLYDAAPAERPPAPGGTTEKPPAERP
jgi:hypothetical protein